MYTVKKRLATFPFPFLWCRHSTLSQVNPQSLLASLPACWFLDHLLYYDDGIPSLYSLHFLAEISPGKATGFLFYHLSEVGVTKIILMKVHDIFQLACHKCGSFSDLRFPSTIGLLAYRFLSNSWEGFGWSKFTFLPLFIHAFYFVFLMFISEMF